MKISKKKEGGDSTNHFIKNEHKSFLNSFKKQMREKQFLTHSEASIILIPNSNKDIIKKKKSTQQYHLWTLM